MDGRENEKGKKGEGKEKGRGTSGIEGTKSARKGKMREERECEGGRRKGRKVKRDCIQISSNNAKLLGILLKT